MDGKYLLKDTCKSFAYEGDCKLRAHIDLFLDFKVISNTKIIFSRVENKIVISKYLARCHALYTFRHLVFYSHIHTQSYSYKDSYKDTFDRRIYSFCVYVVRIIKNDLKIHTAEYRALRRISTSLETFEIQCFSLCVFN